mmetsp:Transcript_26773/g.58318  ORF Transcript_26773/g.58318 Transcript_26773/m.58318 type:complete len:214 (+) Transcript_26773:2658-3299(+)
MFCSKVDFCQLLMCESLSAFSFSISFSSSSVLMRLFCSASHSRFSPNMRCMWIVRSTVFQRRRITTSRSACFFSSNLTMILSYSAIFPFSASTSSCSEIFTMSLCRNSTVLSTPWSSTTIGFKSETAFGSSCATNLASSSTSILEHTQYFLNQSEALSTGCSGLVLLRENCSRTAGRKALENSLVSNSGWSLSQAQYTSMCPNAGSCGLNMNR